VTDDPKPPEPAIVRVANLFAVREALPTRVAAPLRRMAPEQWSLRMAELLSVLGRAGVAVGSVDLDHAARWAVLVHLVAVLSGTTNDRAHADRRRTGAALHQAGYSEARLSKLLTARGEALRDQVARLARFLRAKGAMPLDLRPLARLVLNEGRDEREAEAARLSIARGFYAAADRAAREETE
jgi:CRISPR system Cascade subunit CasB